jgi:CBS domain-containing protein
MQARDIMTTRVITVAPDTDIREAAQCLLDNRISAVPVIDKDGKLVGIVSEGDLMRRPEAGTGRHRSWWLDLLASPRERALRFVKEHSRRVGDVMSRKVIAVTEDTHLEEIAETLEKNRIKRVPVVKDGKVIGIVSRANLMRGLIARRAAPAHADDRTIRTAIEEALGEVDNLDRHIHVVVSGGVVHLWGAVGSQAEKDAARIAAENAPGVGSVHDEIRVLPASLSQLVWAD